MKKIILAFAILSLFSCLDDQVTEADVIASIIADIDENPEDWDYDRWRSGEVKDEDRLYNDEISIVRPLKAYPKVTPYIEKPVTIKLGEFERKRLTRAIHKRDSILSARHKAEKLEEMLDQFD